MLLKMCNVDFQYPTPLASSSARSSSLSHCPLGGTILESYCSGRSTVTRLLAGEMEPSVGGEVWKHANLANLIGRVASSSVETESLWRHVVRKATHNL